MRRGLRTVVYDDTIPEEQSYESVMPSQAPAMDNYMPEIPGMEDPSLRQVELAEGGVVQREGFAEKGFVQNLSPQDKSRIENVDKIADVFKKAYEKDDVSLLFKKTSTNPNGLLSDAAAINFNKNVKDPYFIKQVAQKLNIKTEEVFDLIDERQNFYELDIQPLLAQKTYQKETKLVNEFIDKGENWLIKNSKNYDNVKDLKRGFKRIFGKDHPFLKNSYVSKQGFTKFNDLFFPDIAKSYRESGNPAYTYTKKKLNNLFEASLYNFNPSVRTKVLNELESIIPKKNPTQGEAYDLRKKFKNSKILKEFNINERLDGPITRLLIRDLGENIVNDINFVRYPRSSTKKFIKFMSDRVSPQYKKQFNIISNAIDDFEKNLSSEAKNKLKIVENINYEHKIPKSVIEQGYADEIEYAKITPVGEEFNVKIKNRQFDGPLSNLTRKYTAASSPEEKKEIVKKMNDLKDNFNKRYNNYLGDITIQETNGKLNFSSKAKVLESSSDIMKKLENNLQKNPELFKSLSNFGSKLSSFGGSLDPDTIKQAIERLPAKQRNLILGAASKLRGASNLGLAAAAELTTGSTPLGVAITALFSAPILIDKLGEGYSLGQSLQDVGSMLTFDTIEELDVDRSMAEKYGGTKAAEGYDIKILTEKMADIQNKLSQLNSEQNQFESDPQYAKLVGKEELFRIQRRRKVLSDELANMEKQYQAIPDKFEKYTAFKDIEKYPELEKNIRKSEDVLYEPFSLDETVMGFDDPRDEEQAEQTIKAKKLLKQFEYKKPKQSLQPLGFLGGVNTYKAIPTEELMNQYLAYGGRVGLAAGTIPRAVNWVAKRIQDINKLIKTKRAKAEDFLEEIEILNKAEELNLTKEQVGQILRQQKQAATEKYLKRTIEGDPDLESRLPYDPNATPGNIKKRKNVYGKYKFTGNESLEDLYELERLGKITRMDMNVYDPRYVEWLDAQIINKEKLYTPKEWENTPEVLKNKMRGRIDPDWETANFGEDFDWDRARSTEIQQTQKLKDFDITGRSKNAYGGRINFEKGSDPKDKPILPINPMIGGEDPRGSLQDPGRRDVLKGMGLLGAGVAAGKLGLLGLSKVAKKAPLTEIVAPMGKTTTEFPTWFPSLIKRVREEGTQIPIFKKVDVPLTETEFNKLQKQGAKGIEDRYQGRSEEYIKASQARGEPRYIQTQDTDEIIGYRYEVKEMPGLKVKDMEGKEIEVEFPNAYGQEVYMTYTKPKISIDPQGQKIKYDAEFYVDDGVPELNWMGMRDDHHVDFYAETVKNIDEVLGGASKVEQYALKAKKPRITSGDEIVSRSDAAYDIPDDFD